MRTRKRSSTQNFAESPLTSDNQLEDGMESSMPQTKRPRRSAAPKKSSSVPNKKSFANIPVIQDVVKEEEEEKLHHGNESLVMPKLSDESAGTQKLDENGDPVRQEDEQEEEAAGENNYVAGGAGVSSCSSDEEKEYDSDYINGIEQDDAEINDSSAAAADGQVPTWSQLIRYHSRLRKKLKAMCWIDGYLKGVFGPSAATASSISNTSNNNVVDSSKSPLNQTVSNTQARFETDQDFEASFNSIQQQGDCENAGWQMIRDARNKLADLNETYYKEHLADQMKFLKKVPRI